MQLRTRTFCPLLQVSTYGPRNLTHPGVKLAKQSLEKVLIIDDYDIEEKTSF